MDGRIGFTGKMAMDTLYLVVDGYEVKLDTRFWQVPYDYVVLKENGVSRESPWIELRRAPEQVTHEPEFHLLYKTAFPAKAWINGDTVKVYETGIFFNRIRFTEGLNRIEAGVLSVDSSFTTYTQEFNYVKKPDSRVPFPLWIDESSITPQMDMVLLPDDQVNISFRGSRGQSGQVIFHPDHRSVPCNRTDFSDYSLYEAEIPLNDWETGRKNTFSLMLMPTEQENTPGLEIFTKATITTRRLEEFPWIRIGQDNTRLTYNLGAVRLGGPLKAEYPPGVVMKTNGIAGDHYRVTLNQVEQGFVQMENVEELPFSYTRSPYFITSLACGPVDSADVLSIPYPLPVPYAVIPEPELKRIRIRLYGAKTSSTWISHRQGCRLIDRIGWEQVTPETYEVHVYLKKSAIWGYDLAREGNALTFRVKYPPEFDPMSDNPLAGLKIAIEAGHGGESYGAMGLSGLLEKDINLDLSLKFGDLCRSQGAEVI
jgi:N-acetylmuramoyl-L-alanine amidase